VLPFTSYQLCPCDWGELSPTCNIDSHTGGQALEVKRCTLPSLHSKALHAASPFHSGSLPFFRWPSQ